MENSDYYYRKYKKYKMLYKKGGDDFQRMMRRNKRQAQLQKKKQMERIKIANSLKKERIKIANSLKKKFIKPIQLPITILFKTLTLLENQYSNEITDINNLLEKIIEDFDESRYYWAKQNLTKLQIKISALTQKLKLSFETEIAGVNESDKIEMEEQRALKATPDLAKRSELLDNLQLNKQNNMLKEKKAKQLKSAVEFFFKKIPNIQEAIKFLEQETNRLYTEAERRDEYNYSVSY